MRNTNTIKELQTILMHEVNRLDDLITAKQGDRSNHAANIRKCLFLEELLDCIKPDVQVDVEGCWGDEILREGFMPNAGSVVEVLVNIAFDKKNRKTFSKQWDATLPDIKVGVMDYEIKSVLSCKSKNTAPTTHKPVLLLNRNGFHIIPADEVASCTDKYGRFKANAYYGNANHPTVKYLNRYFGLAECNG